MAAYIPASAQTTTPYLILKTTYAFPAAPQKIHETLVMYQGKQYTKGVYGSYGRGLALQLGIGKMLNSTFGFEMNAEFTLGRREHTSVSDKTDSLVAKTSDRVRGLIFKPMIVIRNSGDLMTIYTKVGLAISTATNRYETGDVRLITNSQGNQTTYESKEISKAKVGFAASFGLSFRVRESISVFVESNGQMLSLPFTKGHYTKYFENGVDKLPGMKISEKSWVYRRSGYFDETSDPNKPQPRLYEPANFSYIGIGAGIIYHF